MFITTRLIASLALPLIAAASIGPFLNEEETFLYTNYEVSVERWIRPARDKARIVASKLGGVVRVKGNLIRTSTGFELEIGRPYVMFLRQIPQTMLFAFGEARVRDSGDTRADVPSARITETHVDDAFIKQLHSLAGQCKPA